MALECLEVGPGVHQFFQKDRVGQKNGTQRKSMDMSTAGARGLLLAYLGRAKSLITLTSGLSPNAEAPCRRCMGVPNQRAAVVELQYANVRTLRIYEFRPIIRKYAGL